MLWGHKAPLCGPGGHPERGDDPERGGDRAVADMVPADRDVPQVSLAGSRGHRPI